METAQTEPTPTHVVTCFLLRRDRGHDEVLLAQRSERVRTYRGAWAAISGYVEPGVSPLDQAYQELREETGMQTDAVTLLRQGAPLPVHDADAHLDWVVHPFLFLALQPDEARADWEAKRFEWTPPERLHELQTVPQLAQALQAVYPPATE